MNTTPKKINGSSLISAVLDETNTKLPGFQSRPISLPFTSPLSPLATLKGPELFTVEEEEEEGSEVWSQTELMLQVFCPQ